MGIATEKARKRHVVFLPEPSTQSKLQILRKELKASILEKDEEIDLTLAAMFGQTTLMFIGAPGLAKSMILETIVDKAIKDAKKFIYLMHKFVEPMEIFGPIDIIALKNGKRSIITANKFPEAHFVFLDEFWNSSIAVAQTLQRAVNERRIDVGNGDQSIPLRCLVIASNKYPDEHELQAMNDRFVLRKFVDYCESPNSRNTLSSLLDHTPKISVSFSLSELDEAYNQIMAMDWPEKVQEKASEIVEKLVFEGIHPSDRKITKIRQIVQTWAYILGENQVHVEHLEVLKHMLWTTGEQDERKKCARIVSELANPIGFAIGALYKEVESILKLNNPTDTETKMGLILDKLEEDFDSEDNRVRLIIEHVKDEMKKNRIRMSGLPVRREN